MYIKEFTRILLTSDYHKGNPLEEFNGDILH